MTDADFSVGALVRARGREWVVLPGSKENFLLLRPLGGEGEIAAYLLPLNPWNPPTLICPILNMLESPFPAECFGTQRDCHPGHTAVLFAALAG